MLWERKEQSFRTKLKTLAALTTKAARKIKSKKVTRR